MVWWLRWLVLLDNVLIYVYANSSWTAELSPPWSGSPQATSLIPKALQCEASETIPKSGFFETYGDHQSARARHFSRSTVELGAILWTWSSHWQDGDITNHETMVASCWLIMLVVWLNIWVASCSVSWRSGFNLQGLGETLRISVANSPEGWPFPVPAGRSIKAGQSESTRDCSLGSLSKFGVFLRAFIPEK